MNEDDPSQVPLEPVQILESSIREVLLKLIQEHKYTYAEVAGVLYLILTERQPAIVV